MCRCVAESTGGLIETANKRRKYDVSEKERQNQKNKGEKMNERNGKSEKRKSKRETKEKSQRTKLIERREKRMETVNRWRISIKETYVEK